VVSMVNPSARLKPLEFFSHTLAVLVVATEPEIAQSEHVTLMEVSAEFDFQRWPV